MNDDKTVQYDSRLELAKLERKFEDARRALDAEVARKWPVWTRINFDIDGCVMSGTVVASSMHGSVRASVDGDAARLGNVHWRAILDTIETGEHHDENNN